MTNRTAANRYARALLDVAVKEKSDLQQIERDVADFAGLLTSHPTLGKVLLNPAVPVGRKRALVAELTGRASLTPVVVRILGVLADRDRLVLVPELLTQYRARLLDHQQVVRAQVTTARPLAKEKTAALETTLSRVTGRTVQLSTQVDPSLIGGVVARIGSTIYDGSVTRQLQKMKARLVEGV
jgi:F-type H+-transporting ATPase subunit delta